MITKDQLDKTLDERFAEFKQQLDTELDERFAEFEKKMDEKFERQSAEHFGQMCRYFDARLEQELKPIYIALNNIQKTLDYLVKRAETDCS